LLATHDVEALTSPWDPWRVGVYALLVLGPAALFWAVAEGLRMGRVWLLGTAAWAVFGYVLIFVPPPVAGLTAAPWIAGFLVLLFAALLAGLTLPVYALGWVIFTHRIHRQDLRRAVRQAGLLALFVVACLGMALFSVFNGLNALLLFVVLALAEFFFLSRGSGWPRPERTLEWRKSPSSAWARSGARWAWPCISIWRRPRGGPTRSPSSATTPRATCRWPRRAAAWTASRPICRRRCATRPS
jgi:hypothetical protein